MVQHVPGKSHEGPDFMSRIGVRDVPPDYETFEKQERAYMNAFSIAPAPRIDSSIDEDALGSTKRGSSPNNKIPGLPTFVMCCYETI